MVRYLGIVKLKDDPKRVEPRKAVACIMDLLNQVSRNDYMLAFRSNDGFSFGVFFNSSVPPASIRTQFQECGTHGEDSLLILEAGPLSDYTSGFTREATWLQHH
jgi:hypothetical protein